MQGPTASEFSGIGAPGRRRGGPAGATATSFGNYFSVDATEERKRAAESKRAKQAENEAAIDWGAQAWAKIKRADVRQADPRYHGDILNTARAAIIRGEKPRPVVELLRQMGVDPSSIMREHGIPTQDEIDGRRAAWLKIGFLLGFALCVVFVATWLK